jgi:hypothetical protein
MAVSGYLNVSGVSTSYQQSIVEAPNALFGSGTTAYLSSINSSFGFGETPHSFSLSYVPTSFDNETLPSIGTPVSFEVEGFLVKGKVVHADYSKDLRGNLLSINVEDNRKDLNNYYIDTVGLHSTSDTSNENLVDVYNWFNKTQVSDSGRSASIRELERIEKDGATYRQIYNAVDYYENTLGTLSGLFSAIPAPEVVESQLTGSVDSYRWRLQGQTALSAIVTILSDVSYDVYWNMAEGKISVANRRYSVSISKDSIPFPGDTAETVHLKYGNDEADRPTKIKVFGPRMEGVVGSGRLIPASGAFNESYDMGVTVGQPVFEAGWRNVAINYFGPDGSLRQDYPTDSELSAALKSIEFWAHEKDLENRISNSGFIASSGVTAGQVSAAGNLAELTSRYNAEKSWVVNWYNKVKSFADSHYGKTYILSSSSDLYSSIDDFDVVNEAWSNIENQASGVFEEGYKIDATYNMLSPFYNPTTNKLRAYCVLPARTKWGVTGEGVPARFESWNEDADNQFVPVQVNMWRSKKTRFSSAAFEWDQSEKGISVTFPQFCFDPSGSRNTELTASSSGLAQANVGFASGTWTQDFVDPLLNPIPFESLNPASGMSVALPIRSRRRYGYSYPSPWTSGTGSDLDIKIEDGFAPFKYEPRGAQTSVDRLTEDVNAYLASQKIDTQDATHAEVTKIGLPGISFDNFANQSVDSNGYGSINHGITAVNVSKGLSEDWRTKYSVKAHFPQLVKAKPIQTDLEEDLSFAIKNIETRLDDFEVDLQLPSVFRTFDDTRISNIDVGGQEEKRSIPVTVTRVYSRNSGDPYYLAVDSRGRSYPRNLDLNAGTTESQQARAQDGLLDVGLEAVYHYERLDDGTFQHWFTGGVDLTDAKVMEVVSDPEIITVGGTDYTVVDLRTLPLSTGAAITITNVPLLDESNTGAVEVGKKVPVSSPKGENNIRTTDFTPDSSGQTQLYVSNTGGGNTTLMGSVVTAPSDLGTGGAISVYVASNGTETKTDGSVVSGKPITVTFINIDPRAIEVGDPIIAAEFKNSTGSGTTFICQVIKATFSNTPYSSS